MMLLRAALGLAILTATWGSARPTTANAAVLCRTRTHQVVLRDACKKRERSVDLAAGGVVGPPGDPGAPGDAGPPASVLPTRVVDATGRSVGAMALIQDIHVSALFEDQGHLVLVPVQSTGFWPNYPLYHLTSDCSDAPLLRSGQVLRALFSTAVVVDGRVYYPGDAELTVKPIAARVDCSFGGPKLPNGLCCEALQYDATHLYWPAVELFSVDSVGYSPPFHLIP